MEFSTTSTTTLHTLKTQAIAVGVYQDHILSESATALDEASNGAISNIVKSEFKANVGNLLTIHAPSGITATRVILLGLGKKEDFNAKSMAKAHKSFAKYCIQSDITSAVSTICAIPCNDADLQDRARMAVRLMVEASYKYDASLSKAKPSAKLRSFNLHLNRSQAAKVRDAIEQGAAIGAGINLARLLGDLPANICTPSYLGNTAKDLARQFKTLKAEVLDKKKIEALKMGSFLAVAKGSAEPPAFIVLRHTPESAAARKAAPIVLVGKGVTFDAGGISIKPGLAMDEMKFDMCGAASVLGTIRTIAELNIQREVIGIIPSCENLPSGTAVKPGDVITSMSGRTIEVLNTDAEGRLILCDALSYAERYKPAAVINMATLTGACVVALGSVNSGLFSRDDELVSKLQDAAKIAQDPVWHMPLDDEYQEQLKSNFADVANIGGRSAGAITAACFLSRFTEKYKWAHLDIAGTAWLQGKDKGATGRPVALLVQYLLGQANT